MPILAEEKSTLQIFNSDQVKSISDWENSFPDIWMLIEVTREDFSQVYEGKLLASAENPVEFSSLKQSLKQKQIVNLTTRGISSNAKSAVWTKL
jgi:hypothetical protein